MNDSPALAPHKGHYELRFTSLFDRGRGFAFPCDLQGRVALAALSERSRQNYLQARATVGAEVSIPVVMLVA